MTDEDEWKKMSASPEKFLKAENYISKPFSGILEAIYPSATQGEKVVPLIRLDFEGGSSLSIFGLDKRNDDGTYPFALGTFIKSCEVLELEVQELSSEDNIIRDIRLVEDKSKTPLKRPKIWIKGIEDKQVGDDQQTKSWFKWGILEKYEIAKPTQVKPGQYPKKPVVKEETSTTVSPELTDTLTNTLMEPKTITELFTGFNKKYKAGELRAALNYLIAEGMVRRDGEKYVVI